MDVETTPGVLNTSSGADLPYLTSNDYVFLLAPIMFGAFFGNALVILAFRKGPRTLRTLTNYFVVNLAVSDMLIGCVSLPIWIAINLDFSDEIKQHIGNFHTSVDILLSVLSIYSLVLISLERLYAIKYPTSHRYLKQKTVMRAIACTWGLAVFLTIVRSIITILYDSDRRSTVPEWITPMVIVTFVLPLTIITASYIILFITALQLTKADNQPTSVTREIRIAKTIFVIISLFVVCWTPFIVLNLLFSYEVIRVDSRYFKEALHITKALHYSKSMMNVFVYAVSRPEFKTTYVKLLTGRVREVRERAYTTMSIKDRNDSIITRAHLAPVKAESLAGSCTVSIQLDEGDLDYKENTHVGIGSQPGAYCTESSHLSEEALVSNGTTGKDEERLTILAD